MHGMATPPRKISLLVLLLSVIAQTCDGQQPETCTSPIVKSGLEPGNFNSGIVFDTPNTAISVALSGNGTVALVGNRNVLGASGVVRAFRWNASTLVWDRMGQRTSDMQGLTNGNAQGHAVAISADGTIALAGAPNFGVTPNFNRGTARAYRWNPSTSRWIRMAAFDEEMAGVANDFAGTSVALSADGTTALIGAIGQSTNPGRARAYRWNSTSWVRMGNDTQMEGFANNGRAGAAVALSADGNIALVTIPAWTSNRGMARAYTWNAGTSTWDRLGNVDADMSALSLTPQLGFSASLSADGTIALLGLRTYANGAFTNAGTAWAYKYNSGTARWARMGNTDNDMAASATQRFSGTSVSLSADGTKALVGTPGENPFVGMTRLFAWNAGTSRWLVVAGSADTDMQGPGGGSFSGNAVALSTNGAVALVGGSGTSVHARAFSCIYTCPVIDSGSRLLICFTLD